MAAIMTTSGAVLVKAGSNVNSNLTGGTTIYGQTPDELITQWINEAEAFINTMTRVNYSDTYTTLNEDVKHILSEIASNLAAIYCINYDMSGYTSRAEAESMITVLRDGALRGLSLLKDKKQTDFIDDA
ncbi:MAG: hypothetical protein ACTSR1_01095 [Candidatus Heimdallarchaeota archaeon]